MTLDVASSTHQVSHFGGLVDWSAVWVVVKALPILAVMCSWLGMWVLRMITLTRS
jgi:hypothetical protein